MIKHVVCFKLKDNSRASCEAARDVLLSMNGRVDLIRNLRVGIDFLHSDRSYDIILEVVLDDEEALEKYQIHPYHAGTVKTYMRQVRAESISVDYVLD